MRQLEVAVAAAAPVAPLQAALVDGRRQHQQEHHQAHGAGIKKTLHLHPKQLRVTTYDIWLRTLCKHYLSSLSKYLLYAKSLTHGSVHSLNWSIVCANCSLQLLILSRTECLREQSNLMFTFKRRRRRRDLSSNPFVETIRLDKRPTHYFNNHKMETTKWKIQYF